MFFEGTGKQNLAKIITEIKKNGGSHIPWAIAKEGGVGPTENKLRGGGRPESRQPVGGKPKLPTKPELLQ
ncbi:MAG: hypothetical protein HW380_3870 [Magnetococcales bacterium]|nr:hypothetical protein [Magnetococcales bacterium]